MHPQPSSSTIVITVPVEQLGCAQLHCAALRPPTRSGRFVGPPTALQGCWLSCTAAGGTDRRGRRPGDLTALRSGVVFVRQCVLADVARTRTARAAPSLDVDFAHWWHLTPEFWLLMVVVRRGRAAG
jgi:hypothetical protein